MEDRGKDQNGPVVSPSDLSANRLTEGEAAVLAQQVSGITRAGLPLSGGLRAMAEELPAGALRTALADVAERLTLGVPLDAALEQMGPRIPEHMRGLVRAGVQSGQLGEILAQYVRCYSLANQLRRKTVLNLAYPAVLTIIFCVVFSFMLVGIVPQFKRIYIDFGVDLPDVTMSLLMLSDAVIDFGPGLAGLFLIALGVGWFAVLALQTPPGRQRLRYRIPLLGPLRRWMRLAEFARLLAMMVECELPLPAALRLAGDGVRDAEIADAARQMALEVEGGRSLAESEVRRLRFPSGLAQSLQWGEGAHSLAESLRTAAEMLEGRARIHAEYVFRVAPPLTMISIVLLLGYVVAGLFMPLIKLINELSG